MQDDVFGHNLLSFKIFNLFGNKNVTISFNNEINILIGENGLGKTTILNILYYTLKCDFNRLANFSFKKVLLCFKSGVEIEISHLDINEANELGLYDKRQHEMIVFDNRIKKLLSKEDLDFLQENYNTEDKVTREIIDRITLDVYNIMPFPKYMVRRFMGLYFGGKTGKLRKLQEQIKNELNVEILYFPTYRRIEEELHKLGAIDEIEFKNDNKALIQFGMKDVVSSFNTILEKIKNSSIEEFSIITGEMLSQYLDGRPHIDKNELSNINPEVLSIILERVGDNITDSDKSKIIRLISSREIFEQDYQYLANFLIKLLKIYDKQKFLDNRIKTFCGICNNYLVKKKIIYNESKVTISIQENNSENVLKLKQLSSGEKQIISIFAKIILDSSKNILILFDEPELSLSIKWQRLLLPDILSTNNCSCLLAVTHSPFIFDNKLDIYADDMSKYVTDTPKDQLDTPENYSL